MYASLSVEEVAPMRRNIIVLFAVALATAFLASCNLGGTGCDVQSKTQGGGSGSVGGRTTPSVCGTASNDFTPNGPNCTSNGTHTSFLYVGDQSTGNIDTFGLSSDGTLEFMCHSAHMDDPVGTMAVSGNKLLFNYSSMDAVLYGWHANGPVLTAVANTPDPVGGIGARLYADPLGRFLYVPNGHSITAMDVNTLGGTPGSPFQGSGITVALHPNGKFLYNLDFNMIWQFSVSDAGALALLQVPSVTYVAGVPVISMKVDPTGKYLYVLTNRSISFYRIDQTSGQLTVAADVPAAALQPNSEAADFTFAGGGQFVYVANPGSITSGMGWVDAFAIDAATGALTPVPGGPFLASAGTPNHVVADPDNQHLWVVVGTPGSSQIFGMTIDPATGALTPPAVSPTGFPFAGKSPAALATPAATPAAQ